MFSQCTSISALAAITFLTQAPASLAGHVRHRHEARMASPKDFNLQVLGRRATAGTVEIQTGQLQMLQSEITTFQGWMDTYINSTKSMDQATALAQLKEEFEAFNGWMNAFLADVLGTGPSTLPALPTTKALTAKPETSVVAAFSSALSTAPASYSSLAAVLASSAPAVVASSSPAAVVPSSSVVASSSPAAVVSSSPVVVSPSSSATSVTAPELLHSKTPLPTTSSVVAPSSAPAPSVSSAPVASVSAVASSTPPSSSPSTGSGGSFNAKSSSNVAVYYGQSGATGQVSLAQLCQDSNVDIVILAFVSDFFGAGGYPTLNLGAACSGASPAQTAKGATGLLSCPTVASQITTCQSQGKRILVSLGGAIGSSAFSGTQQADQFATTLWNLFGGGTGESQDMRPFGQAKVDGFDLDNEDHSTAFYSDFVSALRTTMNADTSKSYYISAAPQCPRPDASIPLDAMQSMDFVWVQFYNNGQCDVGQPGFVDSFKAWSQDLAAKGSGPKLYIGAPGCSACAGAGYVEPAQMGSVIASAKTAGVSNLGGVMLWDGPEAKENTSGGQDYLEVVKSALA